jgi:vacuolar-type H+-ATPase subunit H
MAQDVLERIRDAEIQAEQIKAEARRQAEELLAQARSAASALVEEAKRHARDEGARLIATEESKARHEAEEIRRQGALQAVQIQKDAEKNLNAAVEFVLQRVVMQP